MMASRFVNCWTLVVVLLVMIIAAGSAVIWSKYSRSQAVEISVVPEPEQRGEIYINGEVNNPGLYPLADRDSIADVIRTAGGATDNADLNRLMLSVPDVQGGEPAQKININLAEAWLLEALPGIGEVRAKAIIDYRQKNGPFHNINELVQVEGIGTAVYERIKHLVTVAD